MRFLILLLPITLVSSAPHGNASSESNFHLIILHNNDMHSRFEQTGKVSDRCSKSDAVRNECYGGFARVAHKVREFRRRADASEIPGVLFLNAGDTYSGTSLFNDHKDAISADFMNILNPDAMVRFAGIYVQFFNGRSFRLSGTTSLMREMQILQSSCKN